VLLVQPYRLSYYLIEQLAQSGGLTGIIFEQSRPTVSSQMAFLRRHLRRFGLQKTCDILAYQMYHKLCRRHATARAADAIAPLSDPPLDLSTIPQHTVTNLNQSSARQRIADLSPDVLVVHATRILKPETFQLARHAAFNLHCGLLPKYRGHDSMFWPLYYRDYDHLGATIHLLEKRVDTGAILRRAQVKWTPEDTDLTLWFKAFHAGVQQTIAILADLNQGKPLKPYALGMRDSRHYPHKGLSHFLRYRARQWMGPRAL